MSWHVICMWKFNRYCLGRGTQSEQNEIILLVLLQDAKGLMKTRSLINIFLKQPMGGQSVGKDQ